MKTVRAMGVGAMLLLSACGKDKSVSAPTVGPVAHVPSMAGTWQGYPLWLHQVERLSDGFMTSFNCTGSLTFTQSASAGGAALLNGFAVVGSPCPPVSFPLTGLIQPDGAISFTTGGPRPPQGPCPAVAEAQYTGIVTGNALSARGVANVRCPEFGEHRFTYIITARKSS